MRTPSVLTIATLLAATVSAPIASAQTSLDKLTLYGFLNQAYGVTNKLPILGLNTDPTGDYRAAALQVRYAISPADNFVVQAGHRTMGTSPYTGANGNMSLDWAFFHHRFEHASVRVGRLPVPFGFLSETREVGTLLPFYRAPASYYLESFRSLDGAIANADVSFAGGSLEGAIYGGGTNGQTLTITPTTTVNTRLRLERLTGTELSYRTPIQGIRLRAGLASARSLDTVKVQTSSATKFVVLSAGAEALFERGFLRGEARRIKVGSNQRLYSQYVHGGARVAGGLSVNGQLDLGSSEQYVAPLDAYVGRASADRAFGLSYQFKANVVGKIEQHFAKGGTDIYVATGAETPYTNYSIASFAVSF